MVKRIEPLNSVSLLNVKTVTAPLCLSPESYNVDVGETSVSGLSSGAYMAVQFHVSFSSIVKGAGITAGGKSRKKKVSGFASIPVTRSVLLRRGAHFSGSQ